MAEYRTIRRSFFDDPYVESLVALHKLLYMYMITCKHTNNLGLLEISERKISFESGLSARDVSDGLTKFEQDGKLVRDGQKKWLTRFIRHQGTTSEKLLIGLKKLLPGVSSPKIYKAIWDNYPELFDGLEPPPHVSDSAQIPHGYGIYTVSIPSGELEREMEEEEEENILHANDQKTGRSGRKETYTTKKGRKLAGKKLQQFNRFWTAFAYQKGKAEAADAFLDIHGFNDELLEVIVTAATAEAASRTAALAQGKTPKMAQGWLSGRRWEDEALDSTPTVASQVAAMRAVKGGLQ